MYKSHGARKSTEYLFYRLHTQNDIYEIIYK